MGTSSLAVNDARLTLPAIAVYSGTICQAVTVNLVLQPSMDVWPAQTRPYASPAKADTSSMRQDTALDVLPT